MASRRSFLELVASLSFSECKRGSKCCSILSNKGLANVFTFDSIGGFSVSQKRQMHMSSEKSLMKAERQHTSNRACLVACQKNDSQPVRVP